MIVGIMPQQAYAKLNLTFLGFHQKAIVGNLYGSVAVQDDIPKLVDLAVNGDLKIDKIIEGYFKLEQINEIAEKMEKRRLNGRWIIDWD